MIPIYSNCKRVRLNYATTLHLPPPPTTTQNRLTTQNRSTITDHHPVLPKKSTITQKIYYHQLPPKNIHHDPTATKINPGKMFNKKIWRLKTWKTYWLTSKDKWLRQEDLQGFQTRVMEIFETIAYGNFKELHAE